MFPYPRGPIAHHTQAHLVCGNHAGVLDLLARLAEVGLVVPLMPTAQRHEATCSAERQAKAFGIAPRPLPPRSLGPLVAWTGPTASGTRGTRRHLGPINAQHHHPPAPLARGPLRDARLDRLARRRHSPHGQPCCPLGWAARACAQRPCSPPGEIVQERLGLVLGALNHHASRSLLPIELAAPRGSVQRFVEGRGATAAGATRAIRPLKLDAAPHRLHRTATAGRAVKSRSHAGQGACVRLCSPA